MPRSRLVSRLLKTFQFVPPSPECFSSVLSSPMLLTGLSSLSFLIWQLFGWEQAAAPVCAVHGFIGWLAAPVFGEVCVCVLFDC